MALTSTSRQTNVARRVVDYLNGLSLTGSPTLLLRDDPRRVTGPLLRVTCEFPGAGMYTGRAPGGLAVFQEPILAVLDLFWPTADTSETSNLWSFSLVLDELKDAFRALRLGVKDYSADPSSPVDVAQSYIDFSDPEQDAARTEDGYRRVRLICRGYWFAHHTISRS